MRGRIIRAALAAAAGVTLATIGAASAAIIVTGNTGEVDPANPANWTSSTTGRIGINSGKSGILTLNEGSRLTSLYGYLGNSPGSCGTVVVTGLGSSWINGGSLSVGFNGGSGTLTIENGATVSSSYGDIGRNVGSYGRATITGPGSSWINSSNLSVGFNGGSGTLTIENGATVSSSYGDIGRNLGSCGTVMVTGAGSSWTNSNSLSVGFSGSTGTLTIQNGAVVSSNYSDIGRNVDSSGTVIVTGPGSTWTNSSSLSVGYSGGTGTRRRSALSAENGHPLRLLIRETSMVFG